MSNKQIRYLANITLSCLGVLFLALVVVRASLLSITHDEAYTYLYYMRLGVDEIMLYKGPPIPNNHILNTLLAKLSVWLFGLSTFNLRMPNVLFAILYFFYAGLLAKEMKTLFGQISAFVIICSHVFFFDFFPLARGYGMGLALLLAGIYHFYMYRKLQNGHHLYRTLIFCALAAYANFTFLYAYLAVIVVLNFVAYTDDVQGFKNWWVINRSILVVSAVTAIFIVPPLMKIQSNLFGGETNFWNDTVETLTWSLLYNQDTFHTAALWGIAIILIGAILLAFADTFYIKKEPRYFYQEVLLWLAIMVLGQIVQHNWLGTQYLQGRTALMYAPFFFVLIIFIFRRLFDYKEWINYLGLGLVAILLLINLIGNINFTHTLEWHYDQHYKSILKDIEADLGKNPEQPVSLGISWIHEPALNFYRIAKELEWLQPLTRYTLQEEHDYYLINPELDAAEIEKAKAQNWPKIAEYKNGLVLYRSPQTN